VPSIAVNRLRHALIKLVLGGSMLLPAMLAAAEPVVRAQLTPRRQALLSAEIAARIRELHATEGGRFEAGDPLVTFDASLPQAQVARAEAALSAAERTLSTNRRLLELNSTGQMEVDLAEAEVRKTRADLSYARALLERCRIVAPFAGRVAEQRVYQDEFVQVGQALLVIIDEQSPRIDFIAPSKWLAWVHVGQRFRLRIDETDRDYDAVIESIGARVDPVSQSVKIVAGLVGQHPELVAGMSGSVALQPPAAVP